ncbi:prohibitin family protein [Leptolyngbya sp. FACHB-261]|uniref:prohibitin family protein n=1 Tax=Leptolyngbya sp. FACHB-261 TaxID=2692806 RepID=UPI00168595FC|nr:prohibitin family protein [Leptolyngbya sp. FACHB-261]MBD2104727.1 prohibitin family protein [Leptolyngbya sp. FACHB-261]
MQRRPEDLLNAYWPQLAIIGGLLLLLLVVVSQGLLLVQPGYEAVVFNRLTGLEPNTRATGIHLLIPLVEEPILYDIRTQTYTMAGRAEERAVADDSLTALTADGQRVDLDISVRYRLDPAQLPPLHRNTGPDFLNKIIRPASQAVVRNDVALYSAIGVYSGQRQELQERMEQDLGGLMGQEGLVLQSLLLRNVDFSREFQEAIEAKQIAEQEKERERYRVEQAQLQKQRRIVQAQGEAESLRLRGAALAQNPDVIRLEYVRRLPDDTQTILADPNVILNFSDFLSSQLPKVEQ